MSELVHFQCGHCGQKLRSTRHGHNFPCPKCQAVVVVPTVRPAAAPVLELPDDDPIPRKPVQTVAPAPLALPQIEPALPPMPSGVETLIYVLTAAGLVGLFMPCLWMAAVPMVAGSAAYAIVMTNRYNAPQGIIGCRWGLIVATIVGVIQAIKATAEIERAFRDL